MHHITSDVLASRLDAEMPLLMRCNDALTNISCWPKEEKCRFGAGASHKDKRSLKQLDCSLTSESICTKVTKKLSEKANALHRELTGL